MKKKIVSIFVSMLLFVTVVSVTGAMNIEKLPSMTPKSASTGLAWSDDFDSYTTGSALHGQGGWEAWDNNPATTAYVVDDQARSTPNSCEITWFDTISVDIVQQFTDINSGDWIITTYLYVPSDMSGNSYFILMNDYQHGGPHNIQDWSLQIQFSASTSKIWDFDNPSAELPLIEDAWAELRVEIDFDADIQTVYYDGTFLLSKSWKDGVSPGGAKNLAAIDLYADSAASTSVYWDDFLLDRPNPLTCDANGPYEGNIMEDIEFDSTVTGGIPPYEYLWDYGDGNTSSGDPHPTHNYANAGNYTATLTVTDSEDNTADDTTWVLINTLPNAPIIDGPTSGNPGTKYDYSFKATDPDGEDVKFFIDWGDGDTEWTGFTPSNNQISANHTWTVEDTYTITAYAQDEFGADGPEGTLEVSIPKNREFNFNLPMLSWLFDRFPNAFPILRQLLGL